MFVSASQRYHVSEMQVCSLAFPVTVQLQAFPKNPCLVRQVLAQLRQLCCCLLLLTPNHVASLLHTNSQLHPFILCDFILLLSQPVLILNARPETSYVTSYPPLLSCAIFASSAIYLLPSFGCHLQSGQEFLVTSGWTSAPCLSRRCCINSPGFSRVPECCQSPVHLLPWVAVLSPSRKVQLLTCHCYVKYLKHCIIHFPLPPVKGCGEYDLLFSGDPHAAPRYNDTKAMMFKFQQ